MVCKITVTRHQTVVTDWHCYSKSWHGMYGPKVTVTARYVTFRREGMEDVTVPVDNFAGAYVHRAAVIAGIDLTTVPATCPVL